MKKKIIFIVKWVFLLLLMVYPIWKIADYGIRAVSSETIAITPMAHKIFGENSVSKLLGDISIGKIEDAIGEIDNINKIESIPNEVKIYLTDFKKYYLNTENYTKTKISQIQSDFKDSKINKTDYQKQISELNNRSNENSNFPNYSINRIRDITDYLIKEVDLTEAQSYKLAEAIPFFIITKGEKKPEKVINLSKDYLAYITEKNTTLTQESGIIICLKVRTMFNLKLNQENAKKIVLEIKALKAKYGNEIDNESANTKEAFGYLKLLEDHCLTILNRSGLKKIANIGWFIEFNEPIPGLEE